MKNSHLDASLILNCSSGVSEIVSNFSTRSSVVEIIIKVYETIPKVPVLPYTFSLFSERLQVYNRDQKAFYWIHRSREIPT